MGWSAKPPVRTGSDAGSDAFDAVPPSFGDEEGVTHAERRLLGVSGEDLSVRGRIMGRWIVAVFLIVGLGRPDGGVQHRFLWPAHHLFASDGCGGCRLSDVRVLTDACLDIGEDSGADLWRQESDDLLTRELDEYVGIGISVERRVGRWSAQPEAGGVDVSFDWSGTGDEARGG